MVIVLGTKVLIKGKESLDKTEGGIYIPDNAQEKPAEGKIISIGEKVEGITEGDHAYFGKYAGTNVELEGEELIVMEMGDILAIVREIAVREVS